MKRYNIYVDMDNTLANFDIPNAVKRFSIEKGFFYKLKPIKNRLKIIKDLMINNNVYILSASPNIQADNDKIKWLKKYLPQIKNDNIIMCRLGQNKADFVKTKTNNLLIDDYNKNCFDFVNRGYSAICVSKNEDLKSYIDRLLIE